MIKFLKNLFRIKKRCEHRFYLAKDELICFGCKKTYEDISGQKAYNPVIDDLNEDSKD